MDARTIKEMITAGLPGSHVIVESDDGTHFQARVISEAFNDKSMLQQHRMVYATLGDKMGVDIHALALQTFTPAEWKKRENEF